MLLNDSLSDQMVERLTNHSLVIFLFHGVIDRQHHRVRNYTGKHLEAKLFARCLKRLAHEGYAMSMDEVLAYCESGEAFPENAFAITFDDGFENNISIAAPILADLNIPAMIYVTSGFIDENGMSWIDRVEYAVEAAASQTIEVDWAQETYSLTDTDSRIRFLKAVRAYVKNDSACHADKFADDLCARLGHPGKLSSGDPLDLKMSWAQVRQANESDLLSIGGHSHTHAILSYLTPDQLSFEIDTSLKLLAVNSGVAPTHYSYPEGLSHCYSEQVITKLKEQGVQCCPTAIDGVNPKDSDPFHLRRVMVNGE